MLGDGLRHLMGSTWIAKNHGDELSSTNHLTLYLSYKAMRHDTALRPAI